MRILILIFITLVSISFDSTGQQFSLNSGTDIPYQFYIGGNARFGNVEGYYRTGILTPPYSDVILDLLEVIGTEEIFINVLDASYQRGWMNGIGTTYRFGKENRWYGGVEMRFDYLAAAATGKEVILAAAERDTNNPFISNSTDLEMSMWLIDAGIRAGRIFPLSPESQHCLVLEISASKHLATQTSLSGNGQDLNRLNAALDESLWEYVFKPYGYLGGVGIAYRYNF